MMDVWLVLFSFVYQCSDILYYILWCYVYVLGYIYWGVVMVCV